MKLFQLKKCENSKQIKSRIECIKNSNVVYMIKGAKCKILAKLKNVDEKVKKVSDAKLMVTLKKAFATLNVNFNKAVGKANKALNQAKEKATLIINATKSQLIVDKFTDNVANNAKLCFAKFSDFLNYKIKNLSFDFGVLRDAINQKLLNTNLKLYNRCYYNYVIGDNSTSINKNKEVDFANQIYHEDIDFLLHYPQCYVNMVANYNAKKLKEELKNAVLMSANFAGIESSKKQMPQQSATGEKNNDFLSKIKKNVQKKGCKKELTVSNCKKSKDNNSKQHKSTNLKDLELSFMNYGNSVALNKKTTY